MVELCAKNLQIMRNDFTDYARTFCQLCATILKIMRALFANYAHLFRYTGVSKKNKPATGNIL